ncbi:nuclear hormone receptor FTZ-F1 isoform X2 [Sitodiplosis mosellana]|uniref:nuclear hormone receptor FTZ-F1 isoform X2 n=1 Tax=Sitodiplosis mosellana TaxID=263140 RepID=UPI002443E3EF|nr:nuclear hormone receptor FTZ-F1 isoform X2 [Sitodiplosis mosellana]
MRKTMHEDHKIHPNSTIVVLSNVSLSTSAATNAVNNVRIVGTGGGVGVGVGVGGSGSEHVIADTNSQIDTILADSVKLNLDSSDGPHTTTQYFFSAATPIVTTSTINQLQSNNNTILIENTNADIIVCNGDDTLTVTSGEQQTLSTSCSTSSCTTSCNTPYVIFETNSLPYVQRTIVSERDSSSASVCIDDSGGGGGGSSSVIEIPVDNNNIGDDDIDNNGSDHILKRNSTSVLQRHSFENVDNENDDDDDDEDETSQAYTDTASQHTNQDTYVPSLLPPVGNAINTCDQTDMKYYFEELCPVCGDKVSGYHYGLLTCESCKGFFKRTVQNKKVYTCVAERQCHIDKTQRKRCPFCRFQKCLEVGMKLEAVRADRMRGGRNKFGPMYKRDRARKLQIMRQRQLAVQALRAAEGNTSQLSPTGYQQPYSNMNIKQEIQIPQISSLTSSPDSSPSPIAIALGQVSVASGNTTTTAGNNNTNAGNGNTHESINISLSGTNSALSGGSASNVGGSTTSSANATGLSNPTTDSKLWFANSTTASPHSLSPKAFSFDTSTNPTSTADISAVEPLSLNFPRVSPMIREFVQSVDDREWQSQLFSLLQSQSYNQCEVDLFELMCKVLDQNLFSQVDWARNTVFFKDLKVDDQMKLLQNSWSDMLVLDHLHHRLHNNLPDETPLHNGQKFDLLGLGLLGVPQLADHFNEIQNKLQELKFDVGDYICMKFLLLLNPDVRGITNRKTVLEGYENVQAALLDYTLTCYPSVEEKFAKLISIIPEIHAMAARGEDHLYLKHCAGSAPTQTLLMEMLHAKRK